MSCYKSSTRIPLRDLVGVFPLSWNVNFNFKKSAKKFKILLLIFHLKFGKLETLGSINDCKRAISNFCIQSLNVPEEG